MRTLTILRDPAGVPRGAQAISWQPDGSGRLAVAYSILQFQGQPAGMPSTSHVWDVASLGAPEAALAAPSPLVTLAFNLKDHHLVGGGQYNGQLTFFDLRKGPAPVDATPVAHSHRDAVRSFAWTQSKTGTELMSTSTDGSVLWWDLRRLGGEPLEALTLRERGGGEGGGVLGGTVVEYCPQAGPTKFMVGTEQGAVLAGNRKAKNPGDRITGAYTGGSSWGWAGDGRLPWFELAGWSMCVWMLYVVPPPCERGALHAAGPPCLSNLLLGIPSGLPACWHRCNHCCQWESSQRPLRSPGPALQATTAPSTPSPAAPSSPSSSCRWATGRRECGTRTCARPSSPRPTAQRTSPAGRGAPHAPAWSTPPATAAPWMCGTTISSRCSRFAGRRGATHATPATRYS